VLEDVGEHPYRVERMLYQLVHAGVFARQRVVLLGTFTEYELNANDDEPQEVVARSGMLAPNHGPE